MAGASELDNFVRKFVLLWRAGRNAKLSVEAKAGEAFVNLSVGLGYATPVASATRRRGGAPARQRRTERRAAERLSSSVEAEKASDSGNDINEERDVSGQRLEQAAQSSPIPKVECAAEEAGYAIFDVKVDAHEKCCDSDVIEAIQENFFGELKERQIEKSDPMGDLSVVAVKGLLEEEKVYRIKVKDQMISVVEKWRTPYEFDDLAFNNAVYGEVSIKIKDVKRLS